MLPLKFPLRYYEGQTIGGKPAPIGEPLPLSVIYNGFCQNGSLYSSTFGIPSHNGIDCSNKFKTKVYAAHEGKVIRVYDASNSSPTKGYGVYILSDTIKLPPDFPVHPNEEVRIMSVYWHASEVLVKVGDRVDRETPVISEGNTGKILGRENWTEEDIQQGRGSHLHFGIKLLKPDGITILDENNGYNGYINPIPFFQYQLTFNPNQKTMRYIIDSRNDQYLVYEPLKIAFSIGDEAELKFLMESGLTGEPERINKLIGYTIYPLVRQERLRDIFNF